MRVKNIIITPPALALAAGTTFPFTATAYDRFGKPVSPQPAFKWSLLRHGVGGTVRPGGLYAAPASRTGTDTLRVRAAGVSKTVTVTVTSAGAFTADVDLGGPGQAGHYSSDGAGTYSVSGGGSDIWGAADQFNFAWSRLTGDGVLVARVSGVQDTDFWAKAAIMFRDSLAADAPDAYVSASPHGQVQFLDRPAAGAIASDAGDASGAPATLWEKLVRQGNQFTGFWSSDGIAWNPLGGPVTIPMAATAYVGLAVSAHNDALLNTSTFDDVSVTPMPAGGVYRLATRGQPGMSLDVEGVANADETPVSLYTANHTSNQQWLVQGQGDGTYKIYAYSGQNSLQMLDDTNGNTASGTPVNTYEDNGNSAQRWVFVPVAGGGWRIVPANAAGTDQTLEIQGGSAAGLGSRAEIGTYSGGDNQVFQLQDPGAPATLPNPKKGLAGYPNETGNVHASWVYTWGGDEPAGLPAGVEFVPMAWGYYGNSGNGFVNYLNRVKSQPGVQDLLGFNEPDSSTQANLGVTAALDGWQYLSAAGLPLGSPAAVHADDQWMRDFMAGAARRGYRVDYVTIHWYGGDDPAGFLNYVNSIHALYNKPVWITEFAPADWSGNHGVSTQQAADFMRQVVPQLNKMPFVQRYAWFSAATGDAALGQAALFNGDGSLTDLGRLYARL